MKAQSTGKKGFSTIELLIAFAVVILCISAVIMVTFGNQSVAVDSETNNEAIAKAQALLETARANSRFDFNLVNPSTTTDTSGPLTYTKTLGVTQTDLFTKTVTSTVTWQIAGRTLSTILTTLLTNPEAVGGGDTCSSVLAGDWTNPQKREYALGDEILNDTSSGFPITSITTFNHKLYATVNNENGNNPGTFFILDISQPQNKPVLLSPPLFDNSPVGEGLSDVAVDGENYAYVSSAYTSASQNCLQGNNCAQLQVINISNSASPAVVKSFKVQSIAAGNKLASGTSIFYKNGLVYLGLAKAIIGNSEFFVIDVGGGTGGGSPTNPVVLDSEKIENGVNSIFVKGNYAYVASLNDKELKIFNVSNPNSINEVGGFNAPGGGANNGNGKSLYLVGNTLYLGRTLLSGDEFYILNNQNPATNLPSLGSKNIQDGDDGQPPAPSNTTINGIIVRDYLAFLITNGEFQTWKINSPTSLVRYATPLILPPGSGNLQGTATDCEGNYIFVGSLGSNDKGYISIITGGP